MFWFAKLDRGVDSGLRNAGEFAGLEVDMLVKLHQRRVGHAYVDVGANIGAIALPFARQLPHTTIFAFEAHPVLHGLLMTNTNCPLM